MGVGGRRVGDRVAARRGRVGWRLSEWRRRGKRGRFLHKQGDLVLAREQSVLTVRISALASALAGCGRAGCSGAHLLVPAGIHTARHLRPDCQPLCDGDDNLEPM